MKRTTLFVALASALSLSAAAYAHGNPSSSQNESDWSKSTRRVESMNGQQSDPGLVKQAQEKLSALGKDVGTPDGQLNSRTQEALTDFQQEKGLQPTGQLDQQTIAALDLNQSSAATGSSSANPQGNDTSPSPSDSD